MRFQNPPYPRLSRWSTALALSGKRLLGWSLSYLDFWSDILPYVPQALQLVEILRPAVLHECSIPLAWHLTSDMVAQCMIAAAPAISSEIGDRLLGTPVDPGSKEATLRWWIVFQACDGRRGLLPMYRDWLFSQPECTPVGRNLLQRVTDATPPSTSLNDSALRDWLRSQTRAYCALLLSTDLNPEICSSPFRPDHFDLTTWPNDEEDLVRDLLATADAAKVLYVNKVSILGALAHLTRQLAEPGCRPIADSSLRWLREGLPGWAPPPSGPFSFTQLEGFDIAVTAPALLSLADAVLSRQLDRAGELIADWLTVHGMRTPTQAADIVFRMMIRLALRPGEDPTGFIGMSEAIVEKASADPSQCILTFAYLLAPHDGTRSLILESLDNSRCRTLLRFWERRLREYANHRLPRVRLAVAQTLREWQNHGRTHAALGFPSLLNEAKGLLSRDARSSVRWALREAAQEQDGSDVPLPGELEKLAERLSVFAEQFGVPVTEVVSLKFRPVMPGAKYIDPFGKSDANAYLYGSEYSAGKRAVKLTVPTQPLGQEIARTCVHPFPWSSDYQDFISQFQNTDPPILWVQHETGLEILAAVASVATIIGVALQVWEIMREQIANNKQVPNSDLHSRQVTEVRAEIRYIDHKDRLAQRLIFKQKVTDPISPAMAQSKKWIP